MKIKIINRKLLITAKTDFIDNKSVIFMMRVKRFLFAIKLVEIKNQQHLYALFNSDPHTQKKNPHSA